MKQWAILDEAGEALSFVFTEEEPSAETGYDMSGRTAVEVSEFKSVDQHRLDSVSGLWQEKLNEVKAAAAFEINCRREAAQAKYITAGECKSYAYAQKAAEVGKADAGVPLTAQEYPFAYKEASVRKITPNQALQRFRVGINNSIEEFARIEAEALKALSQIKSCQTIAAVKTVLDGVNYFG